jgi:hypothetical protein
MLSSFRGGVDRGEPLRFAAEVGAIGCFDGDPGFATAAQLN